MNHYTKIQKAPKKCRQSTEIHANIQYIENNSFGARHVCVCMCGICYGSTSAMIEINQLIHRRWIFASLFIADVKCCLFAQFLSGDFLLPVCQLE